MLKVTVAVLAVVLAGTASAAGWRDLRIDATSEASFQASVEAFQDKLSPSRRHAFERALQEIWIDGMQRAAAEQREYTQAEYLGQVDGLAYKEVVTLTDPTGEKAQRYRAEYYALRGSSGCGARCSGGTSPAWNTSTTIRSTDNVPYRGGPTLLGGFRQ